jgi:hypothetical protein
MKLTTKVLLGLAIFFVAMCGVGGWATGVFGMINDIPATSARLDDLHRQAQAMNMPDTAEELLSPTPAERDNAAPQVAELVKRIRAKSREAGKFRVEIKNGSAANPEFAKEELALAYRAAEKPRWQPKRNWDLSFALMLPEYADLKTVVQLLTERAVWRAQTGDSRGSIEDFRVALRIASFVGDEPTIISQLVKAACRAVALNGMLRAASFRAQEGQYLKSLITLIDRPFELDYRQGLKGEVFMAYSLTRNLAAFGGLRAVEGFASGSSGQAIDESKLEREGLPKDAYSRAQLARILEIYISVWEDFGKGDFQTAREAGQRLDAAAAKKTGFGQPSSRLAQILLPVFSQYPIAIASRESNRRAALSMLKSLDYRRQTGQWPKDPTFGEIDELDGKPLRFKIERERLSIWSIGQNLKDDDGVSKRTKGKEGDDLVVSYPPERV